MPTQLLGNPAPATDSRCLVLLMYPLPCIHSLSLKSGLPCSSRFTFFARVVFSLNSLWKMLMLHLVALRILEQVSKALPTRARFRPPARVARSPPDGGAERRWRSLPTQGPLEAKIRDIYVRICREKPAFKYEFCRIALTVFIGEPKHVVINYYRSIISKLFAPK